MMRSTFAPPYLTIEAVMSDDRIELGDYIIGKKSRDFLSAMTGRSNGRDDGGF